MTQYIKAKDESKNLRQDNDNLKVERDEYRQGYRRFLFGTAGDLRCFEFSGDRY